MSEALFLLHPCGRDPPAGAVAGRGAHPRSGRRRGSGWRWPTPLATRRPWPPCWRPSWSWSLPTRRSAGTVSPATHVRSHRWRGVRCALRAQFRRLGRHQLDHRGSPLRTVLVRLRDLSQLKLNAGPAGRAALTRCSGPWPPSSPSLRSSSSPPWAQSPGPARTQRPGSWPSWRCSGGSAVRDVAFRPRRHQHGRALLHLRHSPGLGLLAALMARPVAKTAAEVREETGRRNSRLVPPLPRARRRQRRLLTFVPAAMRGRAILVPGCSPLSRDVPHGDRLRTPSNWRGSSCPAAQSQSSTRCSRAVHGHHVRGEEPGQPRRRQGGHHGRRRRGRASPR